MNRDSLDRHPPVRREQSPVERDWDAWMNAAVGGDEQAYRRLLTSLAGAIRAQVRRGFVRAGLDGNEIEDVVQETLLAVHLKRHTWLRGAPVAPWVGAIAKHKLIDALRRRGRRGEISLETLPVDAVELASTTPPNAAAATYDVERLLAQLDARQREIVHSICMVGYSVRETALRLNMTEVAVRVALHRSLKALAAHYRSLPE